MRIIQGDGIPFRQPRTRHREGAIAFKHLAHGEAGSPQNYEFSIVRNDGRYQAPRHKHNFDQIRLVLRGTFGDGKHKVLKTGQVGYYPEGVPYLIDAQDSDVLLLQFGGASGAGFTHYEQLFQAYAEISKLGEFRDGVFHRADGANLAPGVKRNQDGYEALWQHIHGRPVSYPEPRYVEPVHIEPARFAWVDAPDQPGVRQRTLGVFTECLTEIAQWHAAAGATIALAAERAPLLAIMLQGEGSGGGEPWRAETLAELSPGETLAVSASAPSLLYAITLPFFRDTRAAALEAA